MVEALPGRVAQAETAPLPHLEFLEECVTHLRFPEDHHQRIRTTNRLERLNGESRRRTKVIPRF
ncbi:MAG: transposase, partial [Acidobacteria bacterium]|nr:transposase [Acidobacteriota bacterium]